MMEEMTTQVRAEATGDITTRLPEDKCHLYQAIRVQHDTVSCPLLSGWSTWSLIYAFLNLIYHKYF